MPFRVLFSILALTTLAVAGTFDKPLATKTVDLGPSQSNPPGRLNPVHDVVRCYYFPGFMVKEVDLQEKGAERLAVVPAGKVRPPCTRARSQTEKVLQDWSGYFMGVKRGLVFFRADDGWNGGTGFVVYDARTMKRLFEDVAKDDLQFSDGQPINLTYLRVVDSECNLMKEAAACWTTIQKKFHLESFAAPDCKTGYEEYARAFAKGSCPSPTDSQCQEKEVAQHLEGLSSISSAIAYPVKVTLGANPVPKPVPGVVRCWPVD